LVARVTQQVLLFFICILSFKRLGVRRKEFAMADEHKARVEQNSRRVAEWLAQNRTEFEGDGIGQDKLAAALGIESDDIMEALDHLEVREELVRMPQALTIPPQFSLKPGRGWPEVRDEILGREAGG
jgi:hypothetical protein